LRIRHALAAGILGLLWLLPCQAAVAATISAVAQPAEVQYGSPLTVTGNISEAQQPQAGVTLALQASPYPYTHDGVIAHATSATDGSFSFAGVRLAVNTRLRVLAEGQQTSASLQLQANVDPLVALHSSDLGPGQVRLSVELHHSRDTASPSVSAYWYLAPRGDSRFTLAAVTPSSEPSIGVTRASATIDPPASRFAWRVCLNPAWEAAMGPSHTHGSCPHHDFRLVNAI
jgi:hypothetical protein